MNDPKRLLEDPTLGDEARAALRAAKALRGDASRRDAIWAALVPALPPLPDGGLGGGLEAAGQGAGPALAAGSKAGGANLLGQGAAVGAKAVGWVGFLKAGAVGAGLMGAVLGAQVALSPPPGPVVPPVAVPAVLPAPEAPSVPAVSVASARAVMPTPITALSASVAPPRGVLPSLPAAAPEPAPSAPAEDTPAELATEPPPSPPASAAPPPAADERLERAREEARLVGEAEQALRRGDTAEVQRLLGVLREKHPRGVLGQEREVIAIELLMRTGQQAQASAQADAFLQRNPRSPFADRLRLIAGR